MLGWSSLMRKGAPRPVISWQKLSRPYLSMAKRKDLLSGRLITPGMMATAPGPMPLARPPHDDAQRAVTSEVSASAVALRNRVRGLGLMLER